MPFFAGAVRDLLGAPGAARTRAAARHAAGQLPREQMLFLYLSGTSGSGKSASRRRTCVFARACPRIHARPGSSALTQALARTARAALTIVTALSVASMLHNGEASGSRSPAAHVLAAQRSAERMEDVLASHMDDT